MLNENETKAIKAICDDCDDIDGYGFTRVTNMVLALMRVFNNGQVVGGYISDLMDKGLIEVEVGEDEVWVNPDIYEAYC